MGDKIIKEKAEMKVFKYGDEYFRVEHHFLADRPFIVFSFGETIENIFEGANPFPYNLEEYELKAEVRYSLGQDAAEDKTKWVRRLLSEDIVINICFKEEKKNFCTGSDCILVDDLLPNIEAWRACGGTGIHHKSSAETMKILRDMGVL